VARNRKRAKERRARRPQTVSARTREQVDEPTRPPGPLEHAAPDAAFAEAAEVPPDLSEAELKELEFEVQEDEVDKDEAEFEEEPEAVEENPQALEEDPEAVEEDLASDGREGEIEAAAAVPEYRGRSGNRLLTFLEGSWRELQRVQWPDRRQVMQATGVVIGFVIVAGVFLGAADWVATHLVNFIVNGHY
jgi:preprotein translocase SecE subunit